MRGDNRQGKSPPGGKSSPNGHAFRRANGDEVFKDAIDDSLVEGRCIAERSEIVF